MVKSYLEHRPRKLHRLSIHIATIEVNYSPQRAQLGFPCRDLRQGLGALTGGDQSRLRQMFRLVIGVPQDVRGGYAPDWTDSIVAEVEAAKRSPDDALPDWHVGQAMIEQPLSRRCSTFWMTDPGYT